MYQLLCQRYERRSTIITSNKAFAEWGAIFGDDVIAAAMLDRFVHHCHVLSLKGESYRMKSRNPGGKQLKGKPTPRVGSA
jgi:DNA replication protein DnaC